MAPDPTPPPTGPAIPGDPISDQVMVWFFPGGDIPQLHRAGDAHTAMAKAISTGRPALRSAAERAREGWTGAAAEKFSTDMTQADAWLGRYGTALTQAADILDKHAAKKEQQLQEVKKHIIHAGVDVAAIAGTLGFGLLAAGGAAAAEAATGGLVEFLAPATSSAAATVTAGAVAAEAQAVEEGQAAATALGRVAAYLRNEVPEWGKGIISGHWISLFGRLAYKIGEGPGHLMGALNPANWSAVDLMNIEAGGFLTPLFTAIPKAMGIDALAGWQAYLAQQASSVFINDGFNAYGEFVINGKSLNDKEAWKGIGLTTAWALVAGTAAGKVQNLNAAKAARLSAEGLPFAEVKRPGGFTGPEWLRTAVAAPGDYLIARGTKGPPPPPPPPPLSSAGLGPPPPGTFQSPSGAGPAGGVKAAPQAMDEAGHRISVVGDDLVAAGQRFMADSHLQHTQFGATRGDMELGVQYMKFSDAVDKGLQKLPDAVGSMGPALQMCSRSLAECDQVNAAAARTIQPSAPSPPPDLSFARQQNDVAAAAALAARSHAPS
jgi:uncharacterized protein YukE